MKSILVRAQIKTPLIVGFIAKWNMASLLDRHVRSFASRGSARDHNIKII